MILFKEWCSQNNRMDLIERWDYNLNTVNIDDATFSTSRKYWFTCPNHLHISELKYIKNLSKNTQLNIKCNQCNSFAQWGINNLGEDFLDKYWDYEKNININPWETDKSSIKIIFIKCQEKDYHGSYDVTVSHFVNMNSRCPYCSNHRTHMNDSLGTLYPEILDIWSDKNKKSPYEYSITSNKYVYWECENLLHKDYYRTISDSSKCNYKCPNCIRERKESFLQEKVRLYLESMKFTVFHEYDCTIIPQNPKIKNKKGRMPYDNEIEELKLIIEVHGEQHFRINGFHWKLAKHKNIPIEKSFHLQILRDRYKRIFAKKKGYFYLEIPYWTDDKEETWKQLIDNKINDIYMKEVNVF